MLFSVSGAARRRLAAKHPQGNRLVAACSVAGSMLSPPGRRGTARGRRSRRKRDCAGVVRPSIPPPCPKLENKKKGGITTVEKPARQHARARSESNTQRGRAPQPASPAALTGRTKPLGRAGPGGPGRLGPVVGGGHEARGVAVDVAVGHGGGAEGLHHGVEQHQLRHHPLRLPPTTPSRAGRGPVAGRSRAAGRGPVTGRSRVGHGRVTLRVASGNTSLPGSESATVSLSGSARPSHSAIRVAIRVTPLSETRARVT